FSDSSGRQEAAEALAVSLIDPISHTVRDLIPAKLSKTTVFEVWVEQLVPSHGEDFGWVRLSNANVQPTTPPVAASEDPIASPSLSAAGSAAYRFVPGDQIARAVELQKARRFQELVNERLVDTLWAFLLLWDGDIRTPSKSSTGTRFRLVIAEYEE